MASPCVKRNVFSILSLLVLSSITPLSSSLSPSASITPLSPSDKVTKDFLRQLCTEPTVETHFCIAWLISDPTTFTLDLNGFLSLVILKTQLLAYKNLAMMKGLASTTTDPELKLPYGYCITEYEFAIKAIEEAMRFVSSKEYQIASQEALSAFGSIRSCDVHLERHTNVPAYVPQRNLMFERMCKIDSVFSNVLTS